MRLFDFEALSMPSVSTGAPASAPLVSPRHAARPPSAPPLSCLTGTLLLTPILPLQWGLTPLHLAAMGGHAPVMHALLGDPRIRPGAKNNVRGHMRHTWRCRGAGRQRWEGRCRGEQRVLWSCCANS